MRRLIGSLGLALGLLAPLPLASVDIPPYYQLIRWKKFSGFGGPAGIAFDCFAAPSTPGIYIQKTIITNRISYALEPVFVPNADCDDLNAAIEKAGYSVPGPAPDVQGVRASQQSAAPAPGALWLLSDLVPTSAPATDDAVYALDPNTLQITATVLIPGPIPQGLAINNEGTYVYATVQGVAAGENGIPAHPPLLLAIDASSATLTQTVDLPQGAIPGKPVLSPDDRYIYIPNSASSGGLMVIDTQNSFSMTTIPLTQTLRVGTAPAGTNRAAITPDGELLFLIESQTSPGDIYVVDTTTQQQIADIKGGTPALNDLVLDPTGARLFVAAQTSVNVYNTATLAQTGSVPITKQGAQLKNIGITPDGLTVVTNDQNSTAIFMIDAASLSLTETDLPTPPPSSDGFYISSMTVTSE